MNDSPTEEDTMNAEIKRNSWTRFFKKFNLDNQYRRATVRVKRRGENEVEINQDTPFMGISVTKKGRLIDGVDMFVGHDDPQRLSEPVVSVRQTEKIELEKDRDGRDNRLLVRGKDGTLAKVILTGDKDPRQFRSLVQKVAYSISEQRGFAPDSDVDNWLEAERKIKETELRLVR